MYAIIENGGKQYRVSPGEILFIEFDKTAEPGGTIVFDKVICIGGEDGLKLGDPYVAGASVTASVVKNGKSRKIRVFKYNPKKNYRRRQGHRQPYTKVTIGDIAVG